MGISSIPHVFPGNKRCDYCHRPFKRLYAMEIEGFTVWVCSGAHGEMARKNWEEKNKLGIKPGVPIPPKESLESEMLGDNINEVNESEV